MTIDSDIAALVGFGCEAFFYGCYSVLFAMSVYLMFNGPRRGNGVNKPIFIISILLYLSCSTHFALEFSHFFDVLSTTGVKGFGKETKVLIGADLLISITDFFGELILIYRCWLLWSKNYGVIIFPVLTAIASLGCVSEALRLLLRINPTLPMAPASIVPLGLAGFALPLVTNVIVTTLIAMRIWHLSPRKMHDTRGARFPTTGRATMDIVIESGMLYMVVQLVFVVLFAIQHPALDIVGVIAVQIYGIAPTLILIRVALGLSNMQFGSIRSVAAASIASHPTSSTHVRIGYSTIAFTDAGQRLPPEMPMSEIKSSGDLDSGLSSVKDVATV